MLERKGTVVRQTNVKPKAAAARAHAQFAQLEGIKAEIPYCSEAS